MSAAEFSFWVAFQNRHGFPDERIAAGIAMAGAASCQVHGAKVKPVDLLPKFGAVEGKVDARLRTFLSGVRGVKIRKIPKGGN